MQGQLSRTFLQGPGQEQGLECQGPGPGPGLSLKDQDKDKDFTLVLKESLGQGQRLTSLNCSPLWALITHATPLPFDQDKLFLFVSLLPDQTCNSSSGEQINVALQKIH